MNEPLDHPTAESPKRWWLQAIAVRLRFMIVVAVLFLVVFAWPWLNAVWDRWSVHWSSAMDTYAVSSDSEFFCPMDPGIVTPWPSICPICNMDLISRKKTDAVLLPEGVLARMQIAPYRVQLAGVKTAAVLADESQPESLLVPPTAIVQRETGAVVYLETMPGMYDAIPVTMDGKQNDQARVSGNLKAGQRVVAVGAFLIDAETRLNPNIATQYFGSHRPQELSEPPVLPQRKGAPQPLSESDQRLIAEQGICPVTGAPLGSMGQPVFVMVGERKVALCCKGCEKRMLKVSERYLSVLDEHAKANTDEGSKP